MRYRMIAIYAILLAILVLHPHATMHVASGYRAYLETILNGTLAGLGILAYYGYYRLVERKNEALRASAHKLSDSFRYVDSVNRRLPLLQDIITEPIAGKKGTHTDKKRIFDALLRVATVTVARTDWGLFRFIERRGLKTAGEFFHPNGDGNASAEKVSNKALFSLTRSASLGEQHVAVRTSDHEAPVQAFLILPKGTEEPDAERKALLQAITDQAQLLYKYLLT